MADKPEVLKAIRANDDAFERSVRAQSAAQLVEVFYAEDAVVMPPDQPMVRGRAKIAEFWQGMFKAGLREAKLDIVRLEVSGELASEVGKYTLTLGTAQARGKYLVAHRRQADGSWKAIADMFSGDGPAG